MKFLAGLVALASVAVAAVVPTEQITQELTALDERATADSSCKNGPLTRACWSSGYSIATDFDQKHPSTGNTVTYNFEITNGTCNPDGGKSRLCLLINGQYPGPQITATWGDTVVVNVKNSMQNNGTSIHFHGVRQLSSCGSDGVGGITQCPIAPGRSFTYQFQATQFGTSWYHSHFSNQYGDGVVGPMVFNGPATANYDTDLGVYPINDWYYDTAFQVAANTLNNLQVHNGPPSADNILINGTNKAASGAGKYSYVSMTKGKKYLLRLINMSVDNYIRVSLDNHPLSVITSDYVPIKPLSTNWLLLGIGQRYDVVISANQTAGNYWFRANVATDCLSSNSNNGRAVWSYSGVSVADPTTSPFAGDSGCSEPAPLAPYWVQTVPSGSFGSMASRLNVNLTEAQVVPGGDLVVVWALNQTSLDIDWSNPTINYVMNNNGSYTQSMDVIQTQSEGSWNYWLIQQSAGLPPIPHPIHLHGHDFFVLGQGSTTFTGSETLNWSTPPRRDTATCPGGGWLAIAFQSNNPGLWLMHCHIAWHVSEGLGMQFAEATDSMTLPDSSTFQSNCDAWKSYQNSMYWIKDDSGL
ncbi:multicopper oxidase, type 1 [Lecanosticta acicola]|uniref:laccase n=1 Tax=Lecanosticta acicola TaxID=111012 RepID=A0AAI9EB28_9PEZI|nr:multicopper oxidase, type 1 [Lecanosticta acicola]